MKPGSNTPRHKLRITGDELRELKRQSWSMAGGHEIDGIHLAAPVQVYLDLLSFRGRGEETTQAVLDEVIKPTW